MASRRTRLTVGLSALAAAAYAWLNRPIEGAEPKFFPPLSETVHEDGRGWQVNPLDLLEAKLMHQEWTSAHPGWISPGDHLHFQSVSIQDVFLGEYLGPSLGGGRTPITPRERGDA